MSATRRDATRQPELSAPLLGTNHSDGEPGVGAAAALRRARAAVPSRFGSGDSDNACVIDLSIDRLVDRVAAAVVARLEKDSADRGDEWFDSAQAAEYLGLHRNTLRRLAAARAIPTEQNGRGCKLFLRRPALDEWRQCGGRVRHLAAPADDA